MAIVSDLADGYPGTLTSQKWWDNSVDYLPWVALSFAPIMAGFVMSPIQLGFAVAERVAARWRSNLRRAAVVVEAAAASFMVLGAANLLSTVREPSYVVPRATYWLGAAGVTAALWLLWTLEYLIRRSLQLVTDRRR